MGISLRFAYCICLLYNLAISFPPRALDIPPAITKHNASLLGMLISLKSLAFYVVSFRLYAYMGSMHALYDEKYFHIIAPVYTYMYFPNA
jgi:hypothetical protein